MKLFNLKNIQKEKMKPGHYIYYDKNRKKIYDGFSNIVQHRLLACRYNRSDYAQVNGKKRISNSVKYYDVKYMPASRARKKDRKIKSKYSIY